MQIDSTGKILINEILIDFGKLQIRRENEWRKLDPQCAKALLCLLKNNGSPVSRKVLMDEIWGSAIVSDNSLSKTIALARKSLGDDPHNPKFIRTVSKVGYQLVADVSEPSAKDQNIPFESFLRTYGLAAVVVILIGLPIVILLSDVIGEKSSSSINKTLITIEPGLEAYPRLSPDGRYLLYSYTSKNKLHLHLAALEIGTNNRYLLSATEHDEISGVWSPDGRWLAYIESSQNHCNIRVLPFDTIRTQGSQSAFAGDEYLLGKCNPELEFQQLQWPAHDALFALNLVDGKNILERLALNIEGTPKVTGRELLDSDNPVTFDAVGNRLLVQEYDGEHYNIQDFDLLTGEKSLIEQSKYRYYGLKWRKPGSDFWLAGSGLTLSNMKGEPVEVYGSPRFVEWLDYNPYSDRVVFTEGGLDFNIYHLKLNTKEAEQPAVLAASNFQDYIPWFTADNQNIVYISSQTGVFSIWQRSNFLDSPVQPDSKLLVDMPKAVHPFYFMLSPNDEYLVFSHAFKQFYLLDIRSKILTQIFSTDEPVMALSWSDDSESLYFMEYGSVDSKLKQYDLMSTRVTQLGSYASNSFSLSDVEAMHKILFSMRGQHSRFQVYTSQVSPYLGHIYTKNGVYYPAIDQKKIIINYFDMAERDNVELKNIGVYEHFTEFPISISLSGDSSSLVYGVPEGYDTTVSLLSDYE